MSVFWDESAMKSSGFIAPSILAIGDSWFWYPFPGGSLINYLGQLVDAKGHVILAKGNNGAEAFDYVEGKYKRSVREALRLYGSSLSAVFISGGGNDFAGLNDLLPLLKTDCSREPSPADCFRTAPGGLEDFLDGMEHYYRTLIGQIYTYTSSDCHIVMHTYDYAIPDGRGVFRGSSGWLQPALKTAQVPQAFHQDCIKHLVNLFHDRLKGIASGDPRHLWVVNSCGALDPGDWANELHPKGKGFKKIVAQRWRPVLTKLGLA